jgi:TolB protein
MRKAPSPKFQISQNIQTLNSNVPASLRFGAYTGMQKYLVSIIVIIALFLPVEAAHSQYYLGVVQGEAKKIPIGILDIYDDAGNPKLRALALDVLQADLRRSQIFEVMDTKKLDLSYSAKTEPPGDIIKRGGTFGLAGVVWATITRKGRDLVLTGKLYDAASGMRIANKEYFGNEDTFRRMVHTFADEIVSRYTGEKGIARTRIAYVSDKTRAKELYVMDYDGRNALKITADHSICLSPAWSPDGNVLAYVSYRDKNPDLYALDMETGRRWKLSSNEGLNISPAWSPNGKRLALALSKDGTAEIYTMSKSGNDLERITYGAFDNVAPSWSPNGREIVFTSGRAGTPQVYIMGADGTDARRITFEGPYNASPQWSPRGDRIVFVSQVNGVFKIATVNTDGSDFRLLTNGRGSDENPSWSPSGRQIVFSSNREGKSNIYIMNADGTNVERITPNDANYSSPAWSP